MRCRVIHGGQSGALSAAKHYGTGAVIISLRSVQTFAVKWRGERLTMKLLIDWTIIVLIIGLIIAWIVYEFRHAPYDPDEQIQDKGEI